ncbi:hypothetical protein [Georgenia subflava]|uniref:Uncharacterized protein n=1 Tax=Georgenia subflava TaxID=1622177 RepID=A0A6N7EK55_9MICO|nr:hypothetical protein [Georgenia subflava]MPV37177.1 hypothetical protein [Georgenia subflava]
MNAAVTSRGRAHVPFTIVVPTGWGRIPVGKGSREAVEKILDRTFAGTSGPQAARLRSQIQGALHRQLRAAAAQSGVELYLPVERVHGITVPASVIASVPSLDGDDEPMDVLLGVAARHPGAEVIEVGGTPCVRATRAGLASDGGGELSGSPVASRQISYYLTDPTDTSRYVILAATILEADGEGGAAVADAVTELVDAMLTTFRWVGTEAAR